MKIITTEAVEKALAYPLLVDALEEAFSKPFSQPPRQVFLLDEKPDNYDAFALLPSWNEDIIAVKAFTYFPSNTLPDPILHSKILIFSRKNGEPLALVDGTTVTFWRTAGVSGLATRLLSREDSSTMLMVGAGNLASYIIRANASVRPLKKVMVWGNPDGSPRMDKAKAVVDAMAKELPHIEFSVVEDLQSACGESDIIVSATGSPDILIQGSWLKEGTHLDFIGNHHADKRECDTEVITRSKVYVDSYVNAFKEAGEIIVPIEEGVFKKEDIVAELSEMCSGKTELRKNDQEITLFKSIGQAVTDLVAASVVYRDSE
jgi:1-pyrroline-2-carboxylate reductase [NAD(P)H]